MFFTQNSKKKEAIDRPIDKIMIKVLAYAEFLLINSNGLQGFLFL